MGFRFSKRIKIAKGLNLNISKSGLGLSVGGRGGRVSIGPKGTYVGGSIPGTGISYREKVGGSSSPRRMSPQAQMQGVEVKVRVAIDEETGKETITILDRLDNVIDNQTIRRKLLQQQDVKELIENTRRKTLENILEKEELFLGVSKLVPKIQSADDFLVVLSQIQEKPFALQKFEQPYPTNEIIQELLLIEAKARIKSWKFWTLKKLRQTYIEQNFEERRAFEIKRYNTELNQFETRQRELEKKHNECERDRVAKETATIQYAISGDTKYIDAQMDCLFSELELPLDFEVEWGIEGSTIHLNIDLPEIEDFPTKKPSLLSSGKLSIKSKTQKELREDYARCVLGLAFYFASIVMNISPAIKLVTARGYTQRLNKKVGKTTDQYIFALEIDRETINSIDFTQADPIQSALLFKHKMNMTSSYEMKEIEVE